MIEIVLKEENLLNRIHLIRGEKVMLDFDLATLYGTETRTLKQAVRRNINRFPVDFMFELTKFEWNELITDIKKMVDKIITFYNKYQFDTRLFQSFKHFWPSSRDIISCFEAS